VICRTAEIVLGIFGFVRLSRGPGGLVLWAGGRLRGHGSVGRFRSHKQFGDLIVHWIAGVSSPKKKLPLR